VMRGTQGDLGEEGSAEDGSEKFEESEEWDLEEELEEYRERGRDCFLTREERVVEGQKQKREKLEEEEWEEEELVSLRLLLEEGAEVDRVRESIVEFGVVESREVVFWG